MNTKSLFHTCHELDQLCEKITFYFSKQTTFIMDLVCIQDIKLYNIYGKHYVKFYSHFSETFKKTISKMWDNIIMNIQNFKLMVKFDVLKNIKS